MVFSTYKKLRIVFFHWKGLKAPEIGKRLFEEGMMTSRQGIHRFIKRFGARRAGPTTDETRALPPTKRGGRARPSTLEQRV